jgi:hypothetical protein
MIKEEEQGRPTGRLENWYKGNTRSTGTFRLLGEVYDDVRERFVDGAFIHTSDIVNTDQCFEEGSVIKTHFSTYLLGKEMTGRDDVLHTR